MAGCDSAIVARASSRRRSRRAVSLATSAAITFTATVRPRRVSRARNSSPIPPAPMRSRILYCPSVSNIEPDDYNRALNPYLSILRRNRNFRLLYIGQTISQLGDWFNAVAIFALLLDLTGSATAVSWMMIVQFLPVALVASIAGVVTAVAGRNVAFVVNALSFFASAIFIGRTRYDSRPIAAPRPSGVLALLGITDLIEGARYVRHRSHVAALMLVKTGWGLAGGVLLLLAIFGERVFPIGEGSAGGIGVLYGARGVGAGLGPITLRWILGQDPRRLRFAIGPAFFVVGVFYAALAGAPTLWTAALCVLLAHFGGSILWVFSTVLLQLEVPDRFRGRVFATELALVTLMSSASSYWTGYQLDRAGWSPRALSFALGVMFCVPGTLWLLIQMRWREAPPEGEVDATARAEDELLEGRVG